MKTKDFQTEQQKQQDEQLRKIVMTHCVACHQQLDLLNLRLVNFEDLVEGVLQTIKETNHLITQHNNTTKPTLTKV